VRGIVRKRKRAVRVKLIMQSKILYLAIEMRSSFLRRSRSAIGIVVSVLSSKFPALAFELESNKNNEYLGYF